MELQEELKQQAIGLGLCEQWQNEWGNPDVNELCKKFIRGLDFCIKHDYPSLDYIREHFDQKDVERNGIFFQGKNNAVAGQHAIIMGDAEIDLYVLDNQICDIYTRHNAVLNIHLGKDAYAYISVLDHSTVNVISKGQGAKLKSSYFSGTINNKELFDVIHDKNKK